MRFRRGPATVISVLAAHATGTSWEGADWAAAESRETCCTLSHCKPSGQRLVFVNRIPSFFPLFIWFLVGCDPKSVSEPSDASAPPVDSETSQGEPGQADDSPSDGDTGAPDGPSDEATDDSPSDGDTGASDGPSDEATDDSPSDEDTGSPSDVDTGSSDESTTDADTGTSDEPVDELVGEDHGDTDEESMEDTGTELAEPDEEEFVPMWPEGTDPFADEVIRFDPGPDAGFGSDGFPDIVLGSPEGRGLGAGSLHVLSLGEEGQIVLEFTDLGVFDGPGPDLIVFENPFGTWFETAFVEASMDGEEWLMWPCDPEDIDADYPGCAGVGHVFATSAHLLDPTDPEVAGGDAFDLADLGLETARFVRITDTGFNALGYGGIAGGFDLDAVAIANWERIAE